MNGHHCYVDTQIRNHAHERASQLMREEAEATAVEQAVSSFLRAGRIRYGSGETDTFTIESLNLFIYDDEDLAAEDEKAARVMRQGFGHPADSVDRDTLHHKAMQLQRDLTYRAAVAMLEPYAAYFIELDALAA